MCDPPIRTMVREYKVAITIFSIVQLFPQIYQTAGETLNGGGVLTFAGVGPSFSNQQNQTRKVGGSETLSASLMEVNSGT